MAQLKRLVCLAIEGVAWLTAIAWILFVIHQVTYYVMARLLN